jgi:hypothetical protein
VVSNEDVIFLSYAREERAKARMIFEALGYHGWNVFMDEDIPNMERWERYLSKKLDTVRCVLVLWSSAARTSDWVLKEAESGRKRDILVHASLDGEPPPGAFAHFQANNLAGWNGERDNPEFLRLLASVAMKIGAKGAVGTLIEPDDYEEITDAHLALTSSSWLDDKKRNRSFPYQIHIRLVGSKAALKRVQNVLYYFDPAYAQNAPDLVDRVLQAYVRVGTDWRTGFTVYELANGYSVVRADVKIINQPRVLRLSRLVDILDNGPWLKKLYHTWPQENA